MRRVSNHNISLQLLSTKATLLGQWAVLSSGIVEPDGVRTLHNIKWIFAFIFAWVSIGRCSEGPSAGNHIDIGAFGLTIDDAEN
jgi:hypothetical protein